MSSSLQQIISQISQMSGGRLAVVVGAPLIGLAVGYFVGVGDRNRLNNTPLQPKDLARSAAEEDSEEDEEDGDTTDLKNPREECKLVLVVRTDLGMGKGKIAAQCSHATLACYKSCVRTSPNILKQWEQLGQAKIAVQAHSEDELELLQAQAISLGICARIIHDAGRTQIASGSATVLGVGPAEKSRVDLVTGHLKLL